MIIYKITNAVNGKIYVGQTVQDPRRRWALHKYESKHRQDRPLYRSMRKHGLDKFVMEVLEVPPLDSPKTLLDSREVYWIKELNSMSPNGYNLTSGGDGKFYLSEETKARISQSKLGIPRSEATKEACRIGSTGNTNKRGKRLSAASKLRIGASQLGRKASEQTKEKMRNAKVGAKAYNAKKVLCIETGLVYGSAGEAARHLGVQQTSISAVCLGKRRSTGKLTFKFVA
jgi:group I intron endonuclease